MTFRGHAATLIRTVGFLSLMLTVPVSLAGQTCFRGRPQPRCTGFTVLEFTGAVRLNDKTGPTDEAPAFIYWSGGYLRNVGASSALGAAFKVTPTATATGMDQWRGIAIGSAQPPASTWHQGSSWAGKTTSSTWRSPAPPRTWPSIMGTGSAWPWVRMPFAKPAEELSGKDTPAFGSAAGSLHWSRWDLVSSWERRTDRAHGSCELAVMNTVR